MLSNNCFILGTQKHSQQLWKMQSSLASPIGSASSALLWAVDCVLVSLAASHFDKQHLGRSSVQTKAQCRPSQGICPAAHPVDVGLLGCLQENKLNQLLGCSSEELCVMEVPLLPLERWLGNTSLGTGKLQRCQGQRLHHASLCNPALNGVLVSCRPKSCRRSKTTTLLTMARRSTLMRMTKRCSLRNSKRMLR